MENKSLFSNIMDNVSVVIPAYNAAQWIERSITSALNAGDAVCEVIVVDDGSADNTAAICRDMAKEQPRIRLIKTPHQGPGAARQQGVEAARGQWIIFLDSDDTLVPDSINALLNAAHSLAPEGVDIVAGNVMVRGKSQSETTMKGTNALVPHNDFANDVLRYRQWGILHGKLFRTGLFKQINWDTHPTITNHEDAMLLLQLSAATQLPIAVLPGVMTSNYLRRPNSLCTGIHTSFEGVERVWTAVKALPLDKKSLLHWGLGLIDVAFINRGISFGNSYSFCRELRAMSHRHILRGADAKLALLLHSKKLRSWHMRRKARTAPLSLHAPHLTLIIDASDATFRQVRTTIKSILNTGFRNIEIIIAAQRVSPQTAIKLGEMHIRYRRIQLFRPPASLGPGQVLHQAWQKARGTAVMFLQAGDKVAPEPLTDAVRILDSGADLVLMNRLNASKVQPFDQEEELRSILHNMHTFRPWANMMMATKALQDEDFTPSTSLTQRQAMAYCHISLLLKPLNVHTTSERGHLPAKAKNLDAMPLASVNLQNEIAHLLKDADLSDLCPTLGMPEGLAYRGC